VATWVCLLRAINLGKVNQVNMPRLREAMTEAGWSDVRTYVQSGNVVAGSKAPSAAKVAADLRGLVKDVFDVDTPVVVRTPQEIADVLAWDPFPDAVATAPQRTYVVHLDSDPDPAALADLLATDWSPERVAARGRDLAVAYAEALHSSRLQIGPVLKKLGTDGTARNWRTLTAIDALCRG
jgi:uncharacterized protein (DUF1697 family)